MAMSKFTGWQEMIGELRELFAQRSIDTAYLRDLSSKLTGHSSPDDVGNAVRKLVEANLRLLLTAIGPEPPRFEMLSVMLERVATYNPPEPLSARWTAFVNYARFLKHFGNLAVHAQTLDALDIETMVPAVCKLSHLLLMLLPQPALVQAPQPQPSPAPAVARPKPRLPSPDKSIEVPTSTLWVGNIPTTMFVEELRQLAGATCTACFIKPGKWTGPGTGTPYNYAFLAFNNPADAAAVKEKLLAMNRGFTVRFRSNK